jgi:hypothetical protein
MFRVRTAAIVCAGGNGWARKSNLGLAPLTRLKLVEPWLLFKLLDAMAFSMFLFSKGGG